MSSKKGYSFLVRLLKSYVIYAFELFYSEYIVVGRENIPTDSPVIFAPNHLNALMDALAVHSIVEKNRTITFLARSDIFKNKIIAGFLRSIKIMPAFRMRDGIENLGKNNDIFDNCVDLLHNNNAIGIMPEGNQGEQRKLRTFTKGIFRIAFAAQQKYGSEPGVKIVPVGIDFGSFEKFGKHLIIIIGKPIEVSEFMAGYSENPVSTTNKIRDRLREKLNEITLNLASEQHYECFEIATEVANKAMLENLNLSDSTLNRFSARQKIADKLVSIEKNDPLKIEELEEQCKNYANNVKKIKLHTWIFDKTTFKLSSLVVEGFILLATLPVFLYGFLLNFLAFFVPVFLRKQILKVQFTGFYSSIHFGFGILTFPIFYLIQTLIFSGINFTPWWIIVLFFISQYILGEWALKWYRTFKKFRAKIRYNVLIRQKSVILEKVQNARKKIIQLILD